MVGSRHAVKRRAPEDPAGPVPKRPDLIDVVTKVPALLKCIPSADIVSLRDTSAEIGNAVRDTAVDFNFLRSLLLEFGIPFRIGESLLDLRQNPSTAPIVPRGRAHGAFTEYTGRLNDILDFGAGTVTRIRRRNVQFMEDIYAENLAAVETLPPSSQKGAIREMFQKNARALVPTGITWFSFTFPLVADPSRRVHFYPNCKTVSRREVYGKVIAATSLGPVGFYTKMIYTAEGCSRFRMRFYVETESPIPRQPAKPHLSERKTQLFRRLHRAIGYFYSPFKEIEPPDPPSSSAIWDGIETLVARLNRSRLAAPVVSAIAEAANLKNPMMSRLEWYGCPGYVPRREDHDLYDPRIDLGDPELTQICCRLRLLRDILNPYIQYTAEDGKIVIPTPRQEA